MPRPWPSLGAAWNLSIQPPPTLALAPGLRHLLFAQPWPQGERRRQTPGASGSASPDRCDCEGGRPCFYGGGHPFKLTSSLSPIMEHQGLGDKGLEGEQE